MLIRNGEVDTRKRAILIPADVIEVQDISIRLV